jgi:hypothetical protein
MVTITNVKLAYLRIILLACLIHVTFSQSLLEKSQPIRLKETPSKEFVPSLMLTNVMSLAPKIDEVSLFLLNKNPDVVFITETWLTNAIDKSHINIPEYNVVCKNRSSGSHGGVCLYLRNSISYEIIDHFHNAETEVLWVKIRPTRLPRGFPCIITGTVPYIILQVRTIA